MTNNTYVEDPRQNSSGMTALLTRVRAFTLMELMVAVIIIAVLAAVAVPQYKKAVLKSRFSTVMPVAKAVANAQEVYYLGNHIYAEGTDELDVATVTTEKTTVTLSGTTGYDYVLAQRTDMPQLHYIMYQQHSTNYPGEIHCEADDNDDLANALCKSLSDGVARGKILTEGYSTYYIDGSGSGFPPSAMAALDDVDGNDDNTSVELDEETLTKLQALAAQCWPGSTCFVNKKKGTVTRCSEYGQISASGECVPTDTGYAYEVEYNADETTAANYWCDTMNTSGECTRYQAQYYTYNPDGSHTSIQRICDGGVIPTQEGICPNNQYADIKDRNNESATNSHGDTVSTNYCVASSIGSNGKCGTYDRMVTYAYTYDGNNNKSYQVTRYCADTSGTTCKSYVNTYVNKITDNKNNYVRIYCPGSLTSTGTCSSNWTHYSSKTRVTTTCTSTIDWENVTCS